jgi:hypothetical protein
VDDGVFIENKDSKNKNVSGIDQPEVSSVANNDDSVSCIDQNVEPLENECSQI